MSPVSHQGGGRNVQNKAFSCVLLLNSGRISQDVPPIFVKCAPEIGKGGVFHKNGGVFHKMCASRDTYL